MTINSPRTPIDDQINDQINDQIINQINNNINNNIINQINDNINDISDEQTSDSLNDEYFTNSTESFNEPEIYNNNYINNNVLLDEYSNLFNFMIQRRSDLIENNYTEDEIIKILKLYLITQNFPLNQISYILFKFYEYYNMYNITYDNIIEILNNDRNNIIQPQLLLINNLYTTNYTHNQIINVINNLLDVTDPPNLQDVVIATDSAVLEQLNKYTLDTNSDTQCVICMDNMNETQTVCELPCEHLFHDECIKEHLMHYSYKCPICRNQVGASVPLL